MTQKCRLYQRASTVLGGVAAALFAWTFMTSVGHIELAAGSGDMVRRIGAPEVMVSALLAGLAGWGLLALLERRVKHPRRTWSIVAAAVFVVSLLGPLGGVDGAAVLGLMGLHASVAAVVIGGFASSAAVVQKGGIASMP